MNTNLTMEEKYEVLTVHELGLILQQIIRSSYPIVSKNFAAQRLFGRSYVGQTTSKKCTKARM